MVTSKIIGGLGNQMFQYAVGKSLALKNNTELYLDTLPEKNDKSDFIPRSFELDVFNVHYKTHNNYTAKICRKIGNRLRQSFVFNGFTHLFDPNKYVYELKQSFDPQILQETGNIYLRGYWQCEKYFLEIEPIIREEFKFKTKPDERNAALLNEMHNENSVSIHIRRGDYIADEKALDYHGICGTEYYQKAIEILKSELNNPVFYIFSDDFPHVNNEFNFPQDFKLIDFNTGEYSYNDMRLMAACKHHIVANSSFSWWGAWLGANKNKKVIAPVKWFKKAEMDIVPEQWIKI
jgi:hypothetical protein